MVDNTQRISVCMITYNAIRTIETALTSIRAFADVVILDSGSDDGTLEIVSKLEIRCYPQPWLGFGPQKNKCLDFALNDWVLFLDADEYLSEALLSEIKNLDLSDPNQSFRFKRQNCLMGRQVKFSGWGNDRVVRLFNKKTTRFLDRPVHESVIPTQTVRNLNGPLHHHPYPTLESIHDKTRTYARLAHDHLKSEGWHQEPVAQTMLRAGWAFCRPFIFRLGFLDGITGIRVARMAAHYTFLKYQGDHSEIRQD